MHATCNAMLYGITDNLFRRLQLIQNAAERLLTGTRRPTTSHQFCHVCTGCQWSNGSSSNWLYCSSSRCAAKPLRTSLMIASSSVTLDAVVCARPTPTLSLFRELTLGSETGVFRWRDRTYGTVFSPHYENRTLNFCSSNHF